MSRYTIRSVLSMPCRYFEVLRLGRLQEFLLNIMYFLRYKTNGVVPKDLCLMKHLISAQLQTLKTMNFGQVICATSNLQYLPEDVFMPLNKG